MKDNLPYAILEELGIKNSEKLKFIVPVPSTKHYAVFRDKKLNFYFIIDQQIGDSWYYKVRPSSESNLKEESSNTSIKSLVTRFNSWLNLIAKYNELPTILDDEILAKNEERFYKKFRILDDDADIASFDLEQQLFLSEYLDETKTKLKSLKKNKPKEVVKEIEILESEADEIKQNLTKESKNKIIKRLSRFWGRAQKIGLEVIKEVFVNVISEVTNRLLLGP